MGVVVVASGSSPSAYIRGLIRRIDRGDPNGFSPYGLTNQKLCYIQMLLNIKKKIWRTRQKTWLVNTDPGKINTESLNTSDGGLYITDGQTIFTFA